jgi:hypothetical protein
LRARNGQRQFNKFSLFLFKGWHGHGVTTIRLGTKKDKENKKLQKRRKIAHFQIHDQIHAFPKNAKL